MLKIKRFVCNPLAENAYVVSEGSSCVVIDPGFDGNAELEELFSYLSAGGLTPKAILLTHRHLDHILGVDPISKRYNIPVYPAPPESFPCSPKKGSPGKAPVSAEPEQASTNILFGFQVITTPGHTPDSICFYNEKEHVIFTGDTLFAGTIGRTDLPGGNYDDEIRSIMEKLIFLPGETEIYPGHGPSSTIARERRDNPFLEPFNEREEIKELSEEYI